MDRTRLMEVLNTTTCLISNGVRTQSKLPGIPILLWGLLLSPLDAEADRFEKIDCHFVTVGVNPQQAEAHRQDFLALLEQFPDAQRLYDGPSYKHVAGVVGDEMTALRVFGLGQALGLWKVILPVQVGIPPELADEAASLGLIVTTGYKSQFFERSLQSAVG